MRTVRLPSSLSDGIAHAARAEYPHEACGFLFSAADDPDGPVRTVRAVEPAPNTSDEERRRRFVIAPESLRSAERRAAERGQVVSGFYHSHPDHPARPSQFDAEHAWPWYTYLIVSVDRGTVTAVGAFELDGDAGRMRACELRSGPEPDGRPEPRLAE